MLPLQTNETYELIQYRRCAQMEKQQKEKVIKDMIEPERTHEYFRVTSTNSESRPAVVGCGGE